MIQTMLQWCTKYQKKNNSFCLQFCKILAMRKAYEVGNENNMGMWGENFLQVVDDQETGLGIVRVNYIIMHLTCLLESDTISDGSNIDSWISRLIKFRCQCVIVD